MTTGPWKALAAGIAATALGAQLLTAQEARFPVHSSPPPFFAGLAFGNTSAQVRAALGEPDSTSRSPGWEVLYYGSRGLRLSVNSSGGLYGMTATHPDIAHLDRIALGTPKDSVLALWGAPADSSGHSIVYFDEHQTWSVSLRFDTSNRVSAVSVGRVWNYDGP